MRMSWVPALAFLAAGCGGKAAESPKATAHQNCVRLEKLLISDPEEANRAAAAEALGGLREDPECAVRVLVKALREDEGWLVPDEALKALGRLGPLAVSAVDDLILVARGDKPPLDPDHLRDALVRIGPGAVPRLIFHLRAAPSGDEAAYGEAGLASSVLRGIGEPAVPALINVLSDPERKIDAIITLRAMGPRAGDAAPALVRLYREDSTVRAAVVAAFFAMGSRACPAKSLLEELASSAELRGLQRDQVEGALANLRGCKAEPPKRQ
jgi:HEAT repeat protein